jgi:hypothetical protein
MKNYIIEMVLGLFFAAVILLTAFSLAITEGSVFVYHAL